MLETTSLPNQRFFKPWHAYTLAILIVAIITSIGFWEYSRKPAPITTETPQYADKLYVTFLDIVDAKVRDGIAMHFSQPVEAHHLKDFWQISPNIPGQFSQGYNTSEVWFVPDGNLETGINYVTTLKAGLTSTLGGKLTEDYTKQLSLSFSADDFKILKNGKFALLQSTSIDGLGDVKAQVGSNVVNPTLKIYQVDNPEFVIRDLTSTIAAKWGPNGIPDYKTDVSKLQLVATQEKVAHNSAVNLPKETGIYLVQSLQSNGELVPKPPFTPGESPVPAKPDTEKAMQALEVRSQTWMTVNSFGVHFRQDDQEFLLAAQSLKDGQLINNIEFTAFKTTTEIVGEPKNDVIKYEVVRKASFSGIQKFPIVYPNNIAAIAVKNGGEYAIVPVNMAGSLAEIGVYQNLNDSWQGFMYTDRPIYKTKDVIKLRGLLRIDNDGQYRLPERGTKVKMILGSYDSNIQGKIPHQELQINQYGAFFGEINLNGKLPVGKYYLQTEIPGIYNSSAAWFEILEYKKPPFELTAKTDKDEYIEGDQIKVNIKGSRFDGKSFGKEKLTYKVYALGYYETEKQVYNKSFQLNGWGGMCGGGDGSPYNTYYGELIEPEKEMVLNDKGEAVATFDTKKLTKNISQQLTFVVEKLDANGNIITDARPAVVHNGEVNIFLRAFKNQSKTGAAPTALFAAETLSGEKLRNQEFDFKIEQVRYGDVSANPPYEQARITKPLTSGKVRTNGEGVGEFKIVGLDKMDIEFSSVEVSISKRDARGNLITGSQSLYVYGDKYQYEVPTLLNISSDQTNLVPGQKAQLKITAPDNIRVLLAFERGRVYDDRWLDLKKGENVYEFMVKDVYTPTITPTFSVFYNNRYYNEGVTLNVPAMNKLLNVTATTDKSEYNKSQVAKVTIKTTDQSGKPVSTALSLGVIDKAIFALRKSTTLPMHSSFYYFRPRRTNNSSSMTGVSIGESAERGGGGGDAASIWGRDVDVLYWNPEITTNENGEAVVYFPVSGSTVWKGVVYASSNATQVGQTDFEFSSR